MTHSSKPFHFRGRVAPSKSLLNRLLLVQAHAPVGSIRIRSMPEHSEQCEDVKSMVRAVDQLHEGRTVDCGEAGLVFRLIAAYASKRGGNYELTGSPRLLARPHQALISVLKELGTEVIAGHSSYKIQSKGWRDPGAPLSIDRSLSSQFVSAILLNAWDLPFPLELELVGREVSGGYLEMSLETARRLGMNLEISDRRILIPAHQRPVSMEISAEADLSSAFAVAALGAVAGYAEIQDFPTNSLQPDRIFPALLTDMGVELMRDSDRLIVHRAERFRPLRADIGGAPDLFPVLATLCALAPGESVLSGAPHLVHKESNRVEATARLVTLMGRRCETRSDGLRILPGDTSRSLQASFDPVQDHRLVLAATVAAAAGAPLRLTSVDSVDKSFPEFRRIAAPIWGATA